MRILRLATTTTLATLFTATLAAAATIAVVAPQTGPYAALGKQIVDGARAGAAAAGHDILALPEGCEAGTNAELARQIRDAGAVAAVGFLCTESLADILPSLAESEIPAITVGIRSSILMEGALQEDWPLYRLAPADGKESERIGEVVLERWKADPVAILDDGTIYGRELAGAVREFLEAGGISPVFTDTYRPGQEQQIALVRRLQRAGATHVVIGGDRNDVAVIARDAAQENIPLTLLAGDTMRAADRPVALQSGVMAVAMPDYAALSPASAVSTALRAQQVEPEGYLLSAYAAMQVVGEAVAASDGQSLLPRLAGTRVQTVIGLIAFDERHELSDNPFRLQEWRDGRFVAVDVPTE